MRGYGYKRIGTLHVIFEKLLFMAGFLENESICVSENIDNDEVILRNWDEGINKYANEMPVLNSSQISRFI